MPPSTHPLRCRCGMLQGHVELSGISNRMVCYCHDCQAFARFLGRPEDVLDEQGGSEVVQTAPHRIRITHGAEHLAVMRLSDNGMLRWYAACCRTPVGNTMDRRSYPFTGLLSACLDTLPLAPSFGPVRARANTQSATGAPKPQAFGMAGAVLRILSLVLHSRLSGRYRDTPFFTAAGAPVARPTVVSAEARERLRPTPGDS